MDNNQQINNSELIEGLKNYSYCLTQDQFRRINDILKLISNLRQEMEYLTHDEKPEINLGFQMGKLHQRLTDEYQELFDLFSDIGNQEIYYEEENKN